jgi:hypothetical protein
VEFPDLKAFSFRRTPLFWYRVILLLAVGGPAGACHDRYPSFELGKAIVASDWRETDASGRAVVRESGTLDGTEMSALHRCENWYAQARFLSLNGERAYSGQTSFGEAAQSRSALQQQQLQAEAGYRFSGPWALGVRVSRSITWRTIASIEGAAGYPERFGWTAMALGASWSQPVGNGLWSAEAWSGWPLQARMHLQLPGKDAASLNLGSWRQSELSVAWRYPLAAGLRATVRAGVRSTRMGPGPDAVVTRSGIPVAVAHQPQTTVWERPLTLSIDYVY